MGESAVQTIWAEGSETYPERQRADLTGVVVHRIEVSQEDASYGDTPLEIERFFREHPIGVKATGGRMPYPVLIDAEGFVTQMVPLQRVTPHARHHNPTTIGVACIGDFRTKPPAPAQRVALSRVCATLLAELGLDAVSLFAHDELSEASSDPNKVCPGSEMGVAALRDEVTAALAAGDPQELEFVW